MNLKELRIRKKVFYYILMEMELVIVAVMCLMMLINFILNNFAINILVNDQRVI